MTKVSPAHRNGCQADGATRHVGSRSEGSALTTRTTAAAPDGRGAGPSPAFGQLRPPWKPKVPLARAASCTSKRQRSVHLGRGLAGEGSSVHFEAAALGSPRYA